MTQRALATHVSAGEGEITQAAISKYESGKTIPTRPVLKALAKAVGVLPESFWQGYEEAASEMPHHRKFSALSAKFRMQDVVTLLHADNRDVPSPEDLDGWREAISSLPPTEAAQGPLHPLCACVESLGVHILPFDFQTPLLGGFFLWHQGHDFIVLNASETITADCRRFTLAHELGHALLHRKQFPGDEAEKEANAFVSEHIPDIYRFPEKTFAKYAQYAILLTPDNSTYREMPHYLQLQSVWTSRWVGAYWQSRGLTVISTATWSDASSYSFCFCGLEKGTVVAISTIGCKTQFEGRAHFMHGFAAMIEQIHPRLIFCFGAPFIEMYDFRTPIVAEKYDHPRKGVH